jgi:hypothetical protein
MLKHGKVWMSTFSEMSCVSFEKVWVSTFSGMLCAGSEKVFPPKCRSMVKFGHVLALRKFFTTRKKVRDASTFSLTEKFFSSKLKSTVVVDTDIFHASTLTVDKSFFNLPKKLDRESQ